ncbi:MAG: lantibiotic dehydratase, partial [Phycisphaerae bacterium]|nr:lantibiotic dehydratase [Phycisphaerae bacterium]
MCAAESQSGGVREITPSGFFVIRTALLPFGELLAWADGLQAPAAVDDPARLEQALAADRAQLRERLKGVLARREIRDAIFVASPSLDERLGVWLRDPDGKPGQKVERAVLRYFARMTGRATPFGLFAGSSVGAIGPDTRLMLAGRAEYQRHTRLDMDYLCDLTDKLARDPEIRKNLTYRPNSSLYEAAGRLRYAEVRLNNGVRSHHLVAVEITDYLRATLDRATRTGTVFTEHGSGATEHGSGATEHGSGATEHGSGAGARPAALAGTLADADEDVSLAEAEEYINELIDSQILVSDLSPVVTGPEPIHGLIAQLRGLPEAKANQAAERLDEVRTFLAAIDRDGLGVEPDRYHRVAKILDDLPAKVRLSTLFQVDMVKPTGNGGLGGEAGTVFTEHGSEHGQTGLPVPPGATLGPEPVTEIARGVEILHRLFGTRRRDRMVRFREAFVERYGDREVPLVEVLDEEVGIGFERSNAPGSEASPLLDGLLFLPPASGEEMTPWSAREVLLLRKLEDAWARGMDEIVLTPKDLEPFASDDIPPLPHVFAAMATLVAGSDEELARGGFRVLLKSMSGPPGATLLGRFCHADESLHRYVREYLRAEEAIRHDVVFAEIVHLPEGRIGNILSRPVLREHEIPFLGRGGAPEERQIPVDDLRVSVAGGRVILRSARLGREVLPRLTSAHNYSLRSLGMYRFLCALQQQDVVGYLSWSWGPLERAQFLPRISTGRLVLARACWRIDREELEALGQAGGTAKNGSPSVRSGTVFTEHGSKARFQSLQEWRAKRRLPRLVALADGDNELVIDFDNVLSVEMFINLVKDRFAATLVELFPGPDQLCASGPEGRFVHELVVPFVRSDVETSTRRGAEALNARDVESASRRRVPNAGAMGRPTVEALERRGVETASIHSPFATRAFAPGSEWLYVKVYTGSSTADQLLRDVVGPFARDAMRTGTVFTEHGSGAVLTEHGSGGVDRWFFIRYGDPNWHLRVRLHGDPGVLHARVLPALQATAATLLERGWAWRVQFDTYEREVERYGGVEGTILAERVFHADSEAVLAIVDALAGDEGADARWRLTLRGIDMLLADLGLDLDGKLAVLTRAREAFGREFRADTTYLKHQLGDKFRKEMERKDLTALRA